MSNLHAQDKEELEWLDGEIVRVREMLSKIDHLDSYSVSEGVGGSSHIAVYES